jgi:hypothetical protein
LESNFGPIYWVVGALVVTNLGTIITILATAGKAVWWISKLDSRVDDAKECAVRAHKRLDKVEKINEF